ncbi:unnamed protein product [Rotaria sordida]|uniref:Protein translocase subunit SecA n=2 Tax=Rotaria sordida TaxID=392033 RepID=A0A814PGD2_9BILA|nr:unnamed protein product [Rotaria sordida]
MLWTLGYQIKNSFSKNSEKILDENLVNRINSTIENVEDKISTESLSFVNEQVQNQYFLVDNKDHPSTQRRIKMSTNYSRKLKQAAVTKNQQTMKIKSKNKQSEESTDALSSINFFKNRKVDIKTSTNTEILPTIQDKGGSDQSMWRTTSAEISNLYQRVKSGQILKKTDKDEYLPSRFLGISKKWFLTPGIEYIEGLYLDLMISEMFLEISKKHILNDKTIHLLIQCIDSLDGLEWKILDGPTGRESAIRNYTFFLKAALFPLHILQLLKGDSIVNESNISEGLTFKLKAIRINAISAIYNCTIRNKWILTDERLNHIQKYIDDYDREFKNWIIQIFLLIENNKNVNYTKLFNECLKQFEQNENLIHAISYIYEQSKDMNRCKELFDENSITIISSVFTKQNLSQHEKLIVCSIINNYLQSSYSKGLNEIQLRNYAYLLHHSQDNEDLKLEALKSIVLTVEKVKMLPEFMMEILIENMNKGDDKFDNFVILVLRIIAEQQAIFKVDCLASKLLEESIIIRDEIDISFEKASEYNLDCQWISSIVAQMFLTSLQKNIRINDQSIDYLVKSLDSKDKQTCILSAKSLYLVAEIHEIKDPILFDLKEHIESRIHDVSVYLTVAYVRGLATLSSSYGFIAASHVSYLPRIYVFEDLQLGEANFANIVNKKILFLLYNEAANNPFEDDVFRIFDHILLLENEYQVDAIEILRKYSANKFLIPDDTLSALENIVTTPELFNQVFQVIENIIHNKQIVSEKILRIIADNFYLSHSDKLRESSYHLLDMANDNQDISEEIFNIFELEKSSRAISSHYLEAKCAIAYLLEKTKNGYRLTINGFRALAQVINIPWIIDNDILKILLNVSNNGQIIPIDLVGKLTRRFNPYSEQHDFIRIFENLVKNNQDIPSKLSSKLTKALNNPYILDQVLIIFLLEGQKEQYLSVICSVIETKDYFAIDTRNLFVRILYRKSIKNIIARIQTALVHALKIDNQDVIHKAINGLKILVSHHKVVPEKETIDILLSLITSDISNETIRQDIRILLNISTLENNQKCAYELAYLNFDNYNQLLDKLDQFDKPKELLIGDLIERFHITAAERFQFYEAWLDIEEHRKDQSEILLKFLHRFLVNNNNVLFTECYETVKILDQIDFDTAHNILLHSSQAFVDLRQAYLTVIIHQCLFNRAEISSEYIETLASNMMSNFGFDLSQKFLGSLQNISNLSEFENILNFSKIYHIKSSDIYVKNVTVSILKRSLEIKLLGNQIEKVDRLKLGVCLDDLLDKNWTFEQINHFFTIVKESNSREKARYFLSILEIISHYKISPKEENYEKILTILKNSTEDWQKEINKIAIEINFSDKGQIKMSKELVQELQSRNSQNENLKTLDEKKLLDLIEKIKSSNLLSLLFKNIIEEDSNLKNQIPSISISQWTKDHIRLWANMVKAYITHCIDTEDFIIEALAVIKQANFIDTGFHLTDAQILSCLIILNANKNQGRLLQVGTGEGKSTIISVLAVVYALLGSTVDIITSSPVLAERDAKEKENFYSMFDLQCSHNNDKAVYLSGPKVCYRKQIVYGEAAQFQFDTLRTEYAELNTLAGRKCDVAIENLKIPKNFSDFVHSQIPKWIDNAITALIYQENVHYIVHNGLIKPVDYYSTGIVQNSSNWSDGLHQFLQIKHELKMTSETFTTNFLSNRGYFTRYSSKLFGLTGTLGSDKAKQVLGDVYHVDFVIIPSLRQKQHLSLPDIIVMNEKDWLEEICHSAINESSKERGTLVICETIEHTKSIVEKLQQKYRSSAIKLYTMNDMNQEKNVANINPGEIIIATNLAGRGTDIKTEEIEKHGGLHVIVTFMPPNKRVEEQAFGRTSRQGKRGTSQRILNAINLIEYEDFDIQKITQFRDRIEAKMLCDFESCELKIITLKDELFIKFCSLLKEIRSKIREKISWWTNVKNNVKNTFVHVNPSVVESNTLLSIEEQWAMFLRKIDDEKFPINIEKIHADYEKFSENILSNYANDCVIKNPYHCINIGNDLIINDSSLTNQYNEAMKHFDKAIELDSNHCAAAFVGKGWLLIKGKETFIGSNEQEFGYKEAAMRTFRRALEILAEEMALLTSIQTLLQKRSSFNINSPLSKQLVQKLNILGSYCNSLENFVNVIRKSRRLIQITDIIDSKNMKTDVDNSGVFKRVITHDEIEKGIGKWCNIRLISSDQSDRYEASIENCDEIGITKKDEDKFIVIYKHRIENKIAKWTIDDTQLNNWLLTVLFDESILDRNTNSKIYNRIYQKIVSENGYVRADFLAPLQTLSKDREYEVTFNDLTVREDMGTIDQAIETIDKAISKPNLLDRLSNTKRHILSTDYKDIRVSISQINSEILKELINPNIEVQEVTKEMALVQLKDKSSFFHRHLLPESLSPDSYAVNLDIILNNNKIQEESHLQVRNAIEIIEKQTEKNVRFNLTFISANEISKVLRTEVINISKLTVEFLCLNGEKIREKFTKIKSENINLEIFDRKEQLLEVLRSLNIQSIELCTFQNEEKNVNNIKELVNKTTGKRKIEENKEDHICIKLIDLNTQTIDNILSICPNANFNIHFINIDFNSLLNGLNDESINVHFDRLGKETAQILIKQIRKKNLDFSLVFKHLKSTQAQRLIEIAPIDQENIEINKVKSLSELFMSDSKPDLELSEFSGRGIEYLLEISEKKFIPWLSVASVAILGVVQMAVGVALICTGFGATVGMGLITEGAADLLTAYRAYSTRQFSWSDYGKQKAVSLVISAVSMGFSSIKDAAKGAQTIVTGAGQELLEQAGTKLITSGKSAGTTLIKTGQNLKSLAIKFTGITVTEAVAREGLNKIADIGSNFVLEQMKPQISASIQNRVNSKFTESDLFKIIRKMYAIDLMSRKQQMKGKIHRIVIEIINPEHSFWRKQWDSIGGPLCKGMLSSVEKIRGPASMTIRILGTLNGMYEITFIIQNVHDKLLKKLTDIDRDTLSMYQVLNHYCTISKEDTKEILSLLDNEGIKEFNDELENKNFPNKLNTVDFKQFNIHKETIVKFFTSLHENILNVVIDDFNEIMKLVSDAITEQVFRITQSQLISPWSTYGMGELTKTISERIQDHFIVDKNQNSDSQNRENQENQEKGITLKGSEKYNTIAKQIRYNAKDYTIAYSQCEIIYHAQQQQDRSNIGIIDNKTRKYTEEVRTDKPASLSDIIALAAQQNLDIKIVDDPNYQPTNEDKEKGTNIIVYTKGERDINGNIDVGHYQLMLADGAVVDISSDRNNCGYSVIQKILHDRGIEKSIDDLRNDRAQRIEDNPKVFVKIFKAEQWVSSRYPQEANAILVIGAGYKYKKNIEFENIDKENIGKYRRRQRRPSSEGDSESENPNILYRAIREDEQPFEDGLRPPPNHDPNKSATSHIRSGTRAKQKSPWISATHSLKEAARWASVKEGRVVVFEIPQDLADQSNLPHESRTMYDLTNLNDASLIFPKGGPGLRSAESSQEVIIKDHIPPKCISTVYKVTSVSKDEYEARKKEASSDVKFIKTKVPPPCANGKKDERSTYIILEKIEPQNKKS